MINASQEAMGRERLGTLLMRGVLSGVYAALACLSAVAAVDWPIPSPGNGNNNAAVIALTNAIAQAQPGDTVTLVEGTYDFTGTDILQDADATEGNSCVTISKRIRLRGDLSVDREKVIIKGDGAHRLFRIRTSTGNANCPVFENLTFMNAVAKDGNGFGAVAYVGGGETGGSETFTNCVFRGNQAKRGPVSRGARFENCLFENNKSTADYGGAAFYCVAYDCTFRGNQSKTTGGALHNSRAYRCVFSNNVATTHGGALSTTPAEDCVFLDNHATGNGGAMNEKAAQRCVFVGNYAAGNGGALNLSDAYCCAFTNNTASSQGGAMSGTSSAYDSIFSGNTAATGGACANGFVLATNCVFFANKSTGNTAAVALTDVGSVYDCTFRSNRTEYASADTSGTVSGGKGVYNCTFAENYVKMQSGKSAAAGCSGVVLVSNCVFEANHSEGGSGVGGVSLVANGCVIDCKFYNNWDAGPGVGAVNTSGPENGVRVFNCTFTNNASWTGYGVGKNVSLWSNCTFVANSLRTLNNTGACAGILGGRAMHCTFLDHFSTANTYRKDPRLPCVRNNIGADDYNKNICCHASARGCYLYDCSINGSIVECPADRCDIWGLTKSYGLVGGNCALTNCLIRNNSMGEQAFLSWGTSGKGPALVNCTVVSNVVRMFNATNCVAINTIFYGNLDYNGITKMDVECNSTGGLVLTNCLYQYRNATHVPSCIDCIQLAATETPKFNENYDPAYPYYMPRNVSPAVNKGLAFAWPEGAVDLGGYPRLNGGCIDIGCYEAWIPRKGLIMVVR